MKLFKVSMIIAVAFGWGMFCAHMIWQTLPARQVSQADKNPVEKTEIKTDDNGHRYVVYWKHSPWCDCLK